MKRRRLWAPGLEKRMKFIHLVLLLAILVSSVNTFVSIKLLNEMQLFVNLSYKYFIIQFTFISLGILLIVTLVYLVHYGFGAIFRIERILEEISSGDYSLRIHLRKKDFLRPMAKKLNVILDELEKEKGNNKP